MRRFSCPRPAQSDAAEVEATRRVVKPVGASLAREALKDGGGTFALRAIGTPRAPARTPFERTARQAGGEVGAGLAGASAATVATR